jgi:hypothetical protein
MRQDLGFIWFRMSAMVSASEIPNWAVIASKGVRSSHAISTMRSTAASVSFLTTAEPFKVWNRFTVMHMKQHLPEKVCATCGKPFTWRKKWERDWENVKYCSKRCGKAKLAI